ERSVDFVLPSAILALVILMREARLTGSTSRERFGKLMQMSLPFAVGCVVPILLFAVLYLRAGALGALWQGVFVVPVKRVFGAVMDPPETITILPSICLVGVLGISTRLRGALRWIAMGLAAGAAAYSLLSLSPDAGSYPATWYAAYWSIPVLSIFGGFLLWP